jgi:hypothetical protein
MSRYLLAPLAFALVLPAIALADDPVPDAPTAQERFEELIDRLLGRLEPGLEALGEMLGDLSGWHAPEFLPNGDILIRRRDQPSEPAPSEPVPPEDEDAPVTEPFEP